MGRMRGRVIIGCLLLAAGCRSSGGTGDVPEPTLTTIRSYDGSAITLESIQANRGAAILVADTLTRLEKELAEPWREDRTRAQLLLAVQQRWPADTHTANSAWGNAEPAPSGNSRQWFNECGGYSFSISPFDRGMGPSVPTMEAACRAMLESHTDVSDDGLLLAAWRRFSPPTAERRDGYLAARWMIELDAPGELRVDVSESLLGPHTRSTVLNQGGMSLRGPQASHEGYTCSETLLTLLAPGNTSPVMPLIDGMHASLRQDRPFAGIALSEGPSRLLSTDDAEFLQAALGGLANGAAELAWMPRAAARVTVLFSYLIGATEVRARLCLARVDAAWVLQSLDYEPAAASHTGNSGARLDLMPMLRAYRSPSGN